MTLMSAQYLPKRDGADDTSVPSPSCSLRIYGDTADKASAKSTIVSDNGFNPVWREQFVFTVSKPELAVLYIVVKDHRDPARKAFLAYFAAPLAALRRGYRCCQLRNAVGKKIPFCSLLVLFERI
jgi:hypothetical protein